MPNRKNIDDLKSLTNSMAKAKAIYFTEFHGLDVGSLTRLRGEFYKVGVEYRVAKNTLLKLAARQNNIDGLDSLLKGSTAVAISYDEPVSPAKVIKEFADDSDLPTVKGILFDGDLLPGEDFKRLADMPSKDELLSKLVLLLHSPIQKLLMTIDSPMQKLVRGLNALKEKKT